MNGLPAMAYSDGVRKHTQTSFGGYNHTPFAGDGELWDMTNLTGDLYPLLSSRKPRRLVTTLTAPNGFYARDALYWIDGTGFYKDGVLKGTVANSVKRFAMLGAYLVILPDKKYYNAVGDTFGSIEASQTVSATLQNGTYAGEAAEANTIYASGAEWQNVFTEGDVVTVSGCAAHTENNRPAVIREIDGDYLRFDENVFVIAAGGDTEAALTLSRTMPELDYICENENRLWGCKGDTIYASRLGNIFNWEPVTGNDLYGYRTDVGSAGDFTACCSYLGFPCFFKEDVIYKAYGSKPSDFQVMPSASLGVESGSGRSLAIAGETLFYLTRAGVAAYSGGIPQSIAKPFGTERYRNAAAGSDGTKYYISMQDTAGAWSLFVYDTRTNLWHREDALHVLSFGWADDLYFLDSTGKLWLGGNARTSPEGSTIETNVASSAEFGDFTEGDPNKKGVTKLQIRIELDAGAAVTVSIQFDSDGQWRTVKALSTAQKRSYYLPVIPRRCDHYRIKITGTGGWRLHSLTRESYSGSEM